jgi:predicted small metal-binding protein
MKSLHCGDVGFDCQAVVKAKTDKETVTYCSRTCGASA